MSRSLLWINPENRRSYRVVVYQDLLGDWVMVRSWGSLDSSRGGSKTELVNSLDIDDLLHGIRQQRRRRGYRLVTSK